MEESESYDAMLTRLLKEECEEIVMGYEAYRMEMLNEIERRSIIARGGSGGIATSSSVSGQVDSSLNGRVGGVAIVDGGAGVSIPQTVGINSKDSQVIRSNSRGGMFQQTIGPSQLISGTGQSLQQGMNRNFIPKLGHSAHVGHPANITHQQGGVPIGGIHTHQQTQHQVGVAAWKQNIPATNALVVGGIETLVSKSNPSQIPGMNLTKPMSVQQRTTSLYDGATSGHAADSQILKLGIKDSGNIGDVVIGGGRIIAPQTVQHLPPGLSTVKSKTSNFEAKV